MPELRGYSGREVIRILEKMGFRFLRTKGSHTVMRKGTNVCVVPMHHELAHGTLRGALKQAGVSPEEFLANR